MKIILKREKEDPNSTLGRLFFGEEKQIGRYSILENPECFTLEEYNKRGEKVYGETRIPAGTYGIKLRNEGGVNQKYIARYGDMHKGMLWLQDIPNFEYVLIHTGNTNEHTHGCLIVGLFAPEKLHVTTPYILGEYQDAYKKIYPPIADAILRDEPVTIQIRDIISYELYG